MSGSLITTVFLATAAAAVGTNHGAEQPSTPSASRSSASPTPAIATNDNRKPAGTLDAGVLTLDLRAAFGAWRPDADAGPTLRVQAFGEAGVAADHTGALDSGHGRHRDRGAHPERPVEPDAGEWLVRAGRRRVRIDRRPCRRDAQCSLQERSGRHLSVLGDDDRNAAALSRRRGHAALRCVYRRPGRRCGRRGSRLRHHRVDRYHYRETAGDPRAG